MCSNQGAQGKNSKALRPRLHFECSVLNQVPIKSKPQDEIFLLLLDELSRIICLNLKFPRISVITPSYQQGQYLEETIQSVLKQDYPNLEFILIDGGSSDDTLSVIDKYKEHLTYWVSEPDNGQSQAINKGLSKATGSIITWLNSDDLMAEGTLHRIAHLFNGDIGMVYGDTEIFTDKGTSWINKVNQEDFNAQMIGGMPFSQPSCFFNGDIIRNRGFHVKEDLHYGMDYYFFLQLFSIAEAKYCPYVLSHYRFHPSSKSTQQNGNFAHEWACVYSSFISLFDKRRSEKAQSFIFDGSALELPFIIEKPFDDKELNTSYFYFLLNQMKFRYENLDVLWARKLLKEIKKEFPLKYKEVNLRKIHQRTFLPRKVISFFRQNLNQSR